MDPGGTETHTHRHTQTQTQTQTHTHIHTHTHTHTHIPTSRTKAISRNQVHPGLQPVSAWFKRGNRDQNVN